MYSVVLMMAVTAGSEVPDCGRRQHGCYGCSGYVTVTCSGCPGCYGCTGYSNSCGCSGGHRLFGRHGCTGCSGCSGVIYSCTGCTGCAGGVIYMPAVQPEPIKSAPKKEEANQSASATIVVSLPADAKLSFDGAPTTTTSEERVFVSPALPPNRDFHYTLQAEVIREGKAVRVEQTVQVRAGLESHVTLSLPQAVAAK